MWTNRLFEQMDRLFGPVGFDAPYSPASPAPYPPLTIWEDADNLYVEAELPGLSREQIDISVTGGDTLTIAGERRPRGPEKACWLRQECGYGRFSRTFSLPEVVDADKIEAAYDAGVLTLTLPKYERAKPKKIEVKSVGYPALTGPTA
jgi:HSP20 family protein